jgi:L-lactate dehydrogenase complex protein LldG
MVARAVSARADILGRVREALAGSSTPEPIVREYRHGGPAGGALVELLCERLADYRADVRRVPEEAVAEAVAEVCAAHGLARLGVPPGLRPVWRPASVEIVEDAGLSAHELDRLDGVLTACTLAIAETGTLVLAAGPDEGRRALTLVPDVHVCIVRESQIVDRVPAAFDLLGVLVRDERRPLTLVSGPSATSDIELSRVEGVHGPRTLVVLVTS